MKTETQIFKTKQYADSHQTEQKIHVEGHTKPVTRSFLQAKILTEKFLNNENARILDIGCFDGRLLDELDGMLSNADLWGFDINPYLESWFPRKDNFHFISTDIGNMAGLFDLIILSHSILYIPNQSELMSSINRILKNDGILFIQIPNVFINPYYLLMGDQSIIFTETSLKNVLGKFGYKVDVIKCDYFPRELLISAKKNELGSLDSYEESNLFEENIETINHVKKQLGNIKGKNLTVLGTTVNAAFVDEIMEGKIKFFVDENLSESKSTFRAKKVFSPKVLNSTNHTILPFGESGIKIQERFEKLYGGRYTVV